MKIDLMKLAPVSAHKRKKSERDLQYRAKTGKWRVSELAFARLDLTNKGFNLMLDPNGNVVFQLVAEGNAQIMRRRGDAAKKGREFTSDTLRTLLDSNFKGVNSFRLTNVGELDGIQYVALEPWSEEMTTTVTISVETVVDDGDATSQHMIAETDTQAETVKVSEDVQDIAPLEEQNTDTPEEVAVGPGPNMDLSNLGNSEEEEDTVTETPQPKNPFTSF